MGLFTALPLLEQAGDAGDAERLRAAQHLNAHARLEFNIPGVTFGGRYDASPLIVRDGTTPPVDTPNSYIPTACPGGRAPHAWLEDGSSLFDHFGFEWTLLVLGPKPPDAQDFADVADAHGLGLKVVRLEASGLLALFEAPLVLIRPDQIVAWRGHDAAQTVAVLRQAGCLQTPPSNKYE